MDAAPAHRVWTSTESWYIRSYMQIFRSTTGLGSQTGTSMATPMALKYSWTRTRGSVAAPRLQRARPELGGRSSDSQVAGGSPSAQPRSGAGRFSHCVIEDIFLFFVKFSNKERYDRGTIVMCLSDSFVSTNVFAV